MSSNNNSNNYDIDSFLDFSGGCSSPPSRSSSTNPTTSQPSTTVPTMAPPHLALPQSFNGPSHQYDLHPQQTGLLPYGSFSGSSSPSRTPGGSISLSSEFNFASTSDLDSAFFFPEQASGEFVQPSNINFGDDEDLDIDILAGIKEERSPSNASAMSVASSQPSGLSRGSVRKAAAANTDPETEMRIRQILEDVKKRAMSSAESNAQQAAAALPQLSRMKKDEDDMDEDERLLASEEGKKLSSKERRQLRNKVSARAFRSRRKEYISQLESEVNNKTSENTELRDKLRTVEAENQSLRDLTRMLLASPQFSSFLDQLHPITANNNNNASTNVQTSTSVKSENITVHRATVPEIQVLEQQMNNDFSVPSYIPPNQQYSSFNPRKDTNPNQLQGVEDWPLAYPTASGTWGNGSAMVFPAEIVPQDIDLEALVGKDDLCPADGFRPGFSSGILSGKEETPVDYSDSYDSNGQYIFTVFEDELEDVPEHLYDYFQIHEPAPAQKEATPAPAPSPDFETAIPSLGLEKLFAQLEERFTLDSEPSAEHEHQPATSSPERCRDPELLRTLETLEKTYKRVGVFCGA